MTMLAHFSWWKKPENEHENKNSMIAFLPLIYVLSLIYVYYRQEYNQARETEKETNVKNTLVVSGYGS